MKVSMNMLTACFFISLLVTIVSSFFYFVTYLSLGSPMERDLNGCISRYAKDDTPYLVCPDDTMRGRVSAFLAPKAAVASILFAALFFYKLSQGAAVKKQKISVSARDGGF